MRTAVAFLAACAVALLAPLAALFWLSWTLTADMYHARRAHQLAAMGRCADATREAAQTSGPWTYAGRVQPYCGPIQP